MGTFCGKIFTAPDSINTELLGKTTGKLKGKSKSPRSVKIGKEEKNLKGTLQGKTKKEEKGPTELKAAILIQKWFRLWIGKLQARRQIAWRIFQKVEYYGERNQMRLNRFFKILMEEFQKDTSSSKLVLLGSNQLKPHLSTVGDIDELMEIPPDVEVNISLPFSIKNLNLLMKSLKRGESLHYTCVMNLLIITTGMIKNKSNINEVSTSTTKKITIVGDLHGNLDDLLTIFYKNDIPSVNNPYVFNGDLVDRGPNSIEVVMILCYCFVLFPNHVHLNRGNHEDHSLNAKYGFIAEIKTKYHQHHTLIFKAFKSLFSQLPLGTLIDNKIFVVHGGISDETDLNTIGYIERSKLLSIIRPPKRVAMDQTDNWDQAIDILWSDPTHENGCEENHVRGGGKYFGPDVTEKFLQKHNLQLLIRSHECRPEGYEYNHSNKVLTIFSSSNYYHPGSNKGAYIIYTGDVKKLRLVQYVSSDMSLKNIKFKDNVVSMEETAIKELRKTLFLQRTEILKKFQEHDVAHTGKVTIEVYGNVLSEVLGMKLPWRLIQPKISTKDENNLINYESSFEYTSKTKQIIDESSEDILYSNLDILETIFRAIDKDNSGRITMDEFNEAMKVLIDHSDLKTDDIEDLGEMIDADKDGFIDIDEFFEAFKMSRS